MIDGTGTWRLSNFFGNRIYGFDPEWVLTNGSEHTIAGSGQLGKNFLKVVNHGVVIADQSVPLLIDPVDQGSEFTFVNNNLLVASKGGELQLAKGRYDNRHGKMIAKNGSKIKLLDGASIQGGKLEAEGDGRFLIPQGQRPTLENITNDAVVMQDNTGADAAEFTDTVIESEAVVLGGNGRWTMTPSLNNRMYGQQPNNTLVNGKEHTISGSGQLGLDSMRLIKKGLVNADQLVPLLVDPTNGKEFGVVNEGLMLASHGGDLQLGNGRFDNSNGVISAGQGSTVTLLNGATLYGGKIENDGDGYVLVPNGCLVRIHSLVNNGLVLQQNDGRTAGLFSDVVIDSGEVVLNGTGTWRLSEARNNRMLGEAGNKLVNGKSHTIAGSGTVGMNELRITNQGTIVADQETPLVIDCWEESEFGIINEGLLIASGGGELQIRSTSINNQDGTIAASDGSQVSYTNSISLEGGILESTKTGRHLFKNGGVVHLGSLTINGRLLQGTDSSTDMEFTDVVLSSDSVTIDGKGTWRLSNSRNNRVYGFDPTWQLIVEKESTIAGSGQIGTNFMTLINWGCILADQSEPMWIDPSNHEIDEIGSNAINHGIWRSTGEGCIVLSDGVFCNELDGRIEIESSLQIASTAVLENKGLVTGSGSISVRHSGGFVNRGTIAPGKTVGVLKWIGDMRMETECKFELELKDRSSFDQLSVTGSLLAGGCIDVSVEGSFVPNKNDQFVIAAAAAIDGKFSYYRVGDQTFEIINDTIETKLGRFSLIYEDQKIVLTGFEAFGPDRESRRYITK